MWVERTPREIVKRQQKRRMERFLFAISIGTVMSAVSLFVFGKREVMHGKVLVPPDMLFERLPGSLLIGLLVAVIFYFFVPLHEKKTVICQKCGVAKYEDGSSVCSCGGTFRDLDAIKWV
jgi:hypothetical protein